MKIDNSQSIEWLKAGGRTVLVSIIFIGLGWLYLILSQAISSYSWDFGIVSLFAVLGYALAMAILSRLVNKAAVYHAAYSIGGLFILIPLLVVGNSLLQRGEVSSLTTLITVLAGIVAIVVLEVYSTITGLEESQHENQRAGRIQTDHKIWDLTSALYINGVNVQENEVQLRWWRLISPFLPGLGFLISRNLPDSTLTLVGAYIFLFLAIMISWNYSRQLGISIYLWNFDTKPAKYTTESHHP